MVGLVLGGVLLALLLRTVSPGALSAAFASADYRYLAVAAAPFSVIIAAKVSRWRLLFGEDAPSWRTLFSALCAGYGVNTVVPLRLGEFVTAYWVRDRAGLPIARTFSTLAVERVVDAAAVLVIFVAFAPTVALPRTLLRPALVVAALSIVALALLIAAVVWSRRQHASTALLRWKIMRAPRVAGIIQQMLLGVRVLGERHVLLPFTTYTAVIWLSNSVLYWLIVRAFHLDVPLSAGFLLTGVVSLGMAVPSSPGYLGVFDYLVVLTLGLYSVAHAPAVAAALAAHFINFVPVTLVGLGLIAHRGGSAALGVLTVRQPGGPPG